MLVNGPLTGERQSIADTRPHSLVKAGLEFLTVVRSRGDDGRHARAAGRKDQCAKDRRIKSETTMPTHGLMRVLAARLEEMAHRKA